MNQRRHRTWRILASLAVVIHAIGGLQAADDINTLDISVPEEMRAELRAAVADLEKFLGRMTGQEVHASPGATSANVHLVRAGDSRTPEDAADLLPEASPEACCLWPDHEGTVWLVSRTDLGLTHAVYFYLEKLGCRWYFPSEGWTIVPQRNEIGLPEARAFAPAFRSRAFSGTGGFGGSLPLDPERTIQARWSDWQRRNRFGGEFQLSGHTGEAFNVKYRSQLQAHPEWRAMIDGERVPWSQIAKFCVGNPEVVDLYVRDRVEAYRQLREYDPLSPRAWAVSVEPADGGGHCTAPESLAIGSVSDRVFHVANQVARAVASEYPDGRVSLFAYNEHAAVPSIPLEPNVYVMVIPYAFQRTGLSPDQLLDAWSAKVPRMGVYDYWSIPDWSHDLPTFDSLRFGPDRLRGWHERGVDSFLCESTYSSGAMGPAWYIASRLAWNPETDVDSLFEEFLTDCFGTAAEPMRRMLRRWSNGFYLTSHELALSFRDVESAWQLSAGDHATQRRVADYGRYVEYLRLRFDYLQSKRGSDDRTQAAEELVRYAWRIYDSSMIHAFRLSQLMARDERLAGRPELETLFDWQDPEAAAWSTIRPVSNAEVREIVRRGASQFQPQRFEPRRFRGELIRLDASPLAESHDEPTPVLWLNNSLTLHVLCESPGFAFRPRVAAEDAVRMLVTDADGRLIADHSITTGEAWQSSWSDVEIILPTTGLYRVEIISQKRMFRLMLPDAIDHSLPGWSNSQGTPTPRLYFYVPESTSRLSIYANYVAAGPPQFFAPDGTEVSPDLVDGGHLMLIPVPAEHRGKVWSLDRAKCPLGPLRMLNAPESFALAPNRLLVPEDALNSEAE